MSTTDVPAPAQQQGPSGGVKCTTAFRCHDNNSKESCDHDDNYRTVTLHTDGAFTDYYEHLWDLKSNWVTEGVDVVVYGGTYTLDGDRWITKVDVAWNPEWVGTEQTRFFTISDDLLLTVHTPWRVCPTGPSVV